MNLPLALRVTLLLMLCLAGGCQRQATAPPRDAAASSNRVFAVKGIVQELKPAEKIVVIDHEAIPGYMEAMVMPFSVKDLAEVRTVQPGDVVMFRLVVTSSDSWIEGVNKLWSTNIPSRELFRRVREVEPLNLGDSLPDYTFTNQLSQPVHFRDYRGKVSALTFIFTRCPLPNFCPRMVNNFSEANRLLQERARGASWHFFTLSFDPEYDTPSRLRGYAERYQADTGRWSFLTGALIDIDALGEQFGLVFPRDPENPAVFNHNLRTIVIDPAGKIRRVFSGNEWSADELVKEMMAALKRGPDQNP